MAAQLVNSATSDKLKEMDWMKNIEICEIVARDPGQARDVVKAIKKRVGNRHSNTQLFAVLLLEMLMNNCGEHIHKQVIDTGILPILVKIVKKKSDLPVREKIFLLLDAMQTSHGGASGKFPQYYAAYYELVSAGVKFTQTPRVLPSDIPTSEAHKNNTSGKPVSPKREGVVKQSNSQIVPESSIIQKAGTTLEVLREVLDAIDTQHPEGAKDEFTLDLVEQCTFQKQRVMHLVMTSQDEKVVSRAIELNEQLHKVLSRHDALLSPRGTAAATHFSHEEADEEEEAELLFRRIRKGKACMRPEDEENLERQPLGMRESIQGERMHRPLIRPLCLEPQESGPPPPPVAVVIPPPPAKHIEREKFFQEKRVDGQTLAGHMRDLSLHSRNASSSNSGSTVDSSE
ncbi:VHS [Macleaya cordata]|uniref:VHS n=1 Tax=Macleaya cordata TaxID=56857 RepID=A0A200Q419_MACCD|nr:VHS [Macleaya cordata]